MAVRHEALRREEFFEEAHGAPVVRGWDLKIFGPGPSALAIRGPARRRPAIMPQLRQRIAEEQSAQRIVGGDQGFHS